MNWRSIREDYRNQMGSLYDERETDALFFRLMDDLMGIPKHILILDENLEWNQKQFEQWNAASLRLSRGEPIQHISGFEYFLDRKFLVSPDVLIPRPETESLILEAGRLLPDSKEGLNILDIGCGSGCIAISLALRFPNAKVYGFDYSSHAIKLASLNAERLSADVPFWEDDILDLKYAPQCPYQLIVSNPPYIPEKEKIEMHKNVKDFEPAMALFVKDDDPLIFYRAIGLFAVQHLAPEGIGLLEIHESFGEELIQLYLNIGFSNAEILKDGNQKDRFLLFHTK